MRRALDEAVRQAETGAQRALAASHPAGIGFVIVTGQVQQAVEDQHFQLGSKGVAACGALPASGFDADGHVARRLLRGPEAWDWLGGKRENVGGLVLVQKAAVKLPDAPVRCEQNRDLAAETDSGLGFSLEAGEGAHGGELRNRSSGFCGDWFQVWIEEDHRARSR